MAKFIISITNCWQLGCKGACEFGHLLRRLCKVAGWVAGLTANQLGLAELGNKLSRAGWLVAQAMWWQVP